MLIASFLLTSNNTYALTIDDLIGNRDNIAPNASFDPICKKKVDVIVITDYTGDKLAKLQNSISEFKANNSANFDIKTQVSSNIPKLDIAIQYGTYNNSIYGIVGKAHYTGTFRLQAYYSNYYYYYDEDYKICFNPIIKAPGEAPPAATPVQSPTSVTMSNKTTNVNGTTRYFNVYNVSGPIQYNPYGLGADPDIPQKSCTWFQTSWYGSMVGGGFDVLNPFTFQFTFDPNIAFYGYESQKVTNTVRAWSLNQNELIARQDSKAFYIIATDGASTDFYSTSIYNQNNANNYLFGELRSDNLGKYIKDSNAIVLASVDPTTLDMNLGTITSSGLDYSHPIPVKDAYGNIDYWYYPNVYTNGTYNISYSSNLNLQDITLNQLITQYSSDYRLFDNSKIDGSGLISRIDNFLDTPKDKLDLVIGTDKGSSYATNFSNLVKASLTGVDVRTTVVDNTTTQFVGNRSVNQFKDNFILKSMSYAYNSNDLIMRVGDTTNNTWYSLGTVSSGTTTTSADILAYNVKDMGTISMYWEAWGDTTPTDGKYVIGSDGAFYLNNPLGCFYPQMTQLSYSPYPNVTNQGGSYWNTWYRLTLPSPIKEVVQFNSYHSIIKDTGFLFLTEDNRAYVLYYDSVYSFTIHLDLLSYNAQSIFNDGTSAVAFVDTLGNLHKFYNNSDTIDGHYTKLTFNGIVCSGVPLVKKKWSTFVLGDNNALYTMSSYLNGGAPVGTNVKNLDWYSTDYSGIQQCSFTTLDNRSFTNMYEKTGTFTDTYGNTSDTYGLVLHETTGTESIQKQVLYVNGYNDSKFGYTQLLKQTDGEVVTKDYTGSAWSDSNLDDIYAMPIAGACGYTLESDRNGNVNLIANLGYTSTNSVIKLNSAIASQIYETKQVGVYSLNNSLLKSASLRSDADKMFVYISDNTTVYTGNGFGSYFPWALLDQSIISYFQNNEFATYFITPKNAMDARFKPPYINGYTQQSTLSDINASKVRDSLRFENQDQFIAFIKPQYIKSSLEDPNGIYLVQGEDSLSYSLIYDDYETDPQNALNWYFTHDPYAFENSQGLNPYAGQWTTNFNTQTAQVGKYLLQVKAQDRPTNDTRFMNYWKWGNASAPKTVYIHRRPIADFSMYLRKQGSGLTTTIQDNSYDLDRLSTSNRGIAQWKWKWRVQGSSEWTYGLFPSYFDKGPVYEVSLEVLDRQGAWSKPKVVLVDTNVNLTPTIDANPVSSNGWVNHDIPITITADDNGENDFKRLTYTTSTDTTEPGWIGATAYQKVVPITYTAEGIWYLHMRVFDNIGNTSYRYRGPYMIDKTPPGGTAAPYSAGWTNQDVTVTFSPWDNLSGVNKWRYAASPNSGASWGTWSGYAWGPTPSSVTFNYEGIHKLIAEVTDNAGNVNYVTTGTYQIDKTGPVITPDKSGPIEVFDSLTVNINVTDNLSGVRDTKYAFTQTTDKPSGGWTTAPAANFAATINQEGTWFLHVESTDNAGNTSYIIVGSIKIIIVRIYDLTVTLINDITWRDYYFEGSAYNAGGSPTQFTRKGSTDIKAAQMPINNYNNSKTIEFSRDGIDSGCEVSFFLRSYGNPENVAVIAHYTTDDGEKVLKIQPKSVANQLWSYTFTVPLECKTGTYISFDVEAYKNGNVYGNDRWVESWLPLNTDREIFYISGNVLDRLKFNQSH